MKKLIAIICGLTTVMTMTGQTQEAPRRPLPPEEKKTLFQNMDEHGVFNTIEIAANFGTTGLGLEIASPVTKWARLRAGFDYMPDIKVPMRFGVESYLDGKYTNKFGKIQDMMQKITGLEMDGTVEMDSRPTLNTFHILVDIFPFQRNRHWHFTAGFYLGGNSAGKSINTMQEMPSLVALNMYNTLYANVMADDFVDNVTQDEIFPGVYISPDVAYELQDRLGEWGELGVHIGNYKDGTPYMMHPDKDGTVSAKAYVNRFRPYVGFGYSGALSKDGKWQIGVEAGIQTWGGVPKVTTHEGVTLNDLTDLRAKVKRYMNLIKCMPVYPSIACRLSYTF